MSRSTAWNHFERKSVDLAEYSLCENVIKTKGRLTSGVIRHWREKHGINAVSSGQYTSTGATASTSACASSSKRPVCHSASSAPLVLSDLKQRTLNFVVKSKISLEETVAQLAAQDGFSINGITNNVFIRHALEKEGYILNLSKAFTRIFQSSIHYSMFVLAEMKDTVRIPPWHFHMELNEAVTEELNKKFANKVVHNVGLCIALWDIESLDDSYVFPGDGASHTTVHFRYVVFRPFLDEILVGKIKSCSKEGVHVSMEFFDDILLPSDTLQHPSRFDEKEQLWVWEYETEDGKHDLFMDIGEDIRFRVVDETFVDITPTGPDGTALETASTDEKKTPYTVIGTMGEPGLGLLSWWNS